MVVSDPACHWVGRGKLSSKGPFNLGSSSWTATFWSIYTFSSSGQIDVWGPILSLQRIAAKNSLSALQNQSVSGKPRVHQPSTAHLHKDGLPPQFHRQHELQSHSRNGGRSKSTTPKAQKPRNRPPCPVERLVAERKASSLKTGGSCCTWNGVESLGSRATPQSDTSSGSIPAPSRNNGLQLASIHTSKHARQLQLCRE